MSITESDNLDDEELDVSSLTIIPADGNSQRLARRTPPPPYYH